MSEGKAGLKCVKITFVIVCIILLGLSAWYWYYLYLAVDQGDWTALGLYIVSGLMLALFAILGVIAAWKESDNILTYFAIAMGFMVAFGLIQIILSAISLNDCDNNTGAFSFVCRLAGDSGGETQFWVPTIMIFVGTVLGLVFSCVLKRMLKKTDETANYY